MGKKINNIIELFTSFYNLEFTITLISILLYLDTYISVVFKESIFSIQLDHYLKLNNIKHIVIGTFFYSLLIIFSMLITHSVYKVFHKIFHDQDSKKMQNNSDYPDIAQLERFALKTKDTFELKRVKKYKKAKKTIQNVAARSSLTIILLFTNYFVGGSVSRIEAILYNHVKFTENYGLIILLLLLLLFIGLIIVLVLLVLVGYNEYFDTTILCPDFKEAETKAKRTNLEGKKNDYRNTPQFSGAKERSQGNASESNIHFKSTNDCID